MFFLGVFHAGSGTPGSPMFRFKKPPENCKEKAAADLKAKYLVTRLHLTYACYMMQFGQKRNQVCDCKKVDMGGIDPLYG